MAAVETPASSELSRHQSLDTYGGMRTVREFEERVHAELAQSKEIS